MNRTTFPSIDRHHKVRGLVGFSTCALALAVPALTSAQVAKGSPSTSAVNMALPTVLSGATLVGHASSSAVLSMSVSLAPSSQTALTAYANAVSDPNSPSYHHFLTPAQIGAQFGASTSTVNTVVSYLKSKDLTVTLTASNHMAILVKGKVSNIESAFSTKINNYRVAARPDGGPLTFYSNATLPKVPTSFSSQVVYIEGLTNANPPQKRSELRPIDARNIYNATPLYGTSSTGGHKGEGVNIAVSNFDGYRLSQAKLYAQTFNLPLPGGTGTNIKQVIVGGVNGNTDVDEGGEGDLDFQMVLAIAPKCNLYIYDGVGSGLVQVLTQEANDNIADIITESYGWRAEDPAFLAAAHSQHLAMTAQGITYMCASGDSGTSDLNDALTTFTGFPYPDFDPEVLMVGGSEATIGSDGGRGSEVGWVGSGSGWYPPAVSFNTIPPYQKGDGVPTTPNKRFVPDIAVHATEWYVYFKDALQDIGGTSAASPSFAGQLGLVVQALKEQSAIDPTPDGHYRLGRIQDFIYPLVASGSPAFFDLTGLDGATAGTLPDGTQSIPKVGWDFVTGLGAPNDELLYEAYLATSSVNVTNVPTSTAVYTVNAPTLVLGTSPSGNAASLAATDGVSYTLQSVKQNGVGQVAALTIGVPLQTAKAPRSVAVSATIKTPSNVSTFVYLLDTTTNNYTLVNTMAGTGGMTTMSLPIALDSSGKSAFISTSGNVSMLVRALKPIRLGSSPFTLTVDSALVTEKVARG